MCCLIENEKAIPQKGGRAYRRFFEDYPKSLQERAKEYVSDTLPGIVHGKVVRSNLRYLLIGNKRAGVLINSPVTGDVEFQGLADQWKKETMGVSSVSRIAMHPAYQRIMAMGKPALPLILRDLQQNRGNWFHALRNIAGRDVAAGTNSISDARAAWLEWGYQNNYL